MTIRVRFLSTAIGVATFLLLIFAPVSGDPGLVDISFRISSLIILAVSWNLMASAGLISLGHSAFFGLGAYVGILTANKLGLPFPVALVGSMVVGGVAGLSLALATGRLRGIYFAISTLAMSEGLRVFAVMLPDLTGGAKGAYLDSGRFPGVNTVNVSMALAAIAVCVIAWLISRSRYHFAFRAMRANESAAQMLGIYPRNFRSAIMTLSGAMASMAGGIEVWHGGFLDPAIAFDLHNTITAQIAPILGGIYTLSGPILGAVATVLLGDAARISLGHIQGASLLLFGLILVGCVLYLPNGIKGGLDRLFKDKNGVPAGLDKQAKLVER